MRNFQNPPISFQTHFFEVLSKRTDPKTPIRGKKQARNRLQSLFLSFVSQQNSKNRFFCIFREFSKNFRYFCKLFFKEVGQNNLYRVKIIRGIVCGRQFYHLSYKKIQKFNFFVFFLWVFIGFTLFFELVCSSSWPKSIYIQ